MATKLCNLFDLFRYSLASIKPESSIIALIYAFQLHFQVKNLFMVAHNKLSNMKELGDSVSSAAKLKKDTEDFKEETKVLYLPVTNIPHWMNLFL